MGFPAVHWQYEPFDGAAAVYRVLTSRYRQRVKSALLLVVEGIGYRRAAHATGLKDHRVPRNS